MMTDETPKNFSEKKIRRLRLVKRIGMPILFLMGAYIAVPMLIGAFSGLSQERMWDPFTGRLLTEQADAEERCLEEAQRLLTSAGRIDSLVPSWERPAREWTAHCRKRFPAVYQLVIETRMQLRKGEQPGEGGPASDSDETPDIEPTSPE